MYGNLQAYTECRDHQYGSIPIHYFGDFCQLEAVNNDCIYNHPNGVFWEQALTCMVELKGAHRYKDPIMNRVMPDMRANGLAETDRNILNSRVVGTRDRYGNILRMPNIAMTRFATYSNKARTGINQSVFRSYLKNHHAGLDKNNVPTSAIVIRSNPVWARSKVPLSFDQRKVVFEECSESDTSNGRNKRMDPLLCLFQGSHVMGTENVDVKNGMANGTTSTFRTVRLKPGKAATPIQMHGCWVYAVDIGDVDHIELAWQDCHFKGTFKMFPKTGVFQVKYPIVELGRPMRVKANIKFDYFPIVINHATTGHKLQGKSMDALVITEWAAGKRNWAYVVLSRVRKLEGLFLMTPIPKEIDFRPLPANVDGTATGHHLGGCYRCGGFE